jgi:hypothetical protein
MADFVVNVLAVTLAFALLGLIAWPITRLLLGIPPLGGVVDFLLLLGAAIVFVVIREYTDIL